MGSWLLPRLSLTPDQLRAVELPPDGNRLVVGLPGSGKTQALVHRADHLRRAFNVPPGKFRIFIFTNVLRDYIRAGLEMLDLPMESVCTFDAWCHDYFLQHVSAQLPWTVRTKRTPDFGRIRAGVLEHLQNQGRMWTPLDFALVDEGQDLAPDSYAILKLAARHVTVFADYLQQIYSNGADLSDASRHLGLPPTAVSLLGAYRNSPDVARLASYFLPDGEAKAAYLAQTRNNLPERERPLYYVADHFEYEMDRLAQIIRQRMMLNQRVGILVAQNRQVHGLAQGLRERGVEVEKAVPPPVITRASGKTWVRFDVMTPKIAGFYSAKGLTFDCVLMPRLTEESFNRLTGPIRPRLLFVGIARATHWVYLSATRYNAMKELDVLKEAEQAGCLTIQRQGESPKSPGPQAPEGSGDDFSAL